MIDVESIRRALPRAGAPSPLASPSRGAASVSSRRRRLTVRRIRGCDFSTHSDRDLRSSLDHLKGRAEPAAGPDDSLEVFALVNEAVSRRLGAWRLFDPNSDKGVLQRYQDLAEQIIEASPYRDRIEFYSDPDFLDGRSFERCIAPMLQQMRLDSDEGAIVRAIRLRG